MSCKATATSYCEAPAAKLCGLRTRKTAAQDDGNVVVFNAANQPLWSLYTGSIFPSGPTQLSSGQCLGVGQTLVSSSLKYELILQSDGNLVLYNSAVAPVWATHTNGRPSARVCIQSDGNLVLRDIYGNTEWASGSQKLGGVRFDIQNDGNLVIYDSWSQPTWSYWSGVIYPLFAPGYSSQLGAGQCLYPGQILVSPQRNYMLSMQTDGNLVIYNHFRQATWASGTNGWAVGQVCMQGDGNFVMRDPWGNAIWSTNSQGYAGTQLSMQGDGNLVVYNVYGQAIWSVWSGKIIPPFVNGTPTLYAGQCMYVGQSMVGGGYTLVLQPDGNLVIYGPGGWTWQTRTYGQPASMLCMQGDGNVVLRNIYGQAIWTPNTQNRGGTRLDMQGDGNLVVYTTSMQPLWSIYTGRI